MGLLAASARAAEPSAVEQRAREDLDRQLQEMVKTPPPEIIISFEGLPGAGTSKGYKLVEADFLVNGQPLAIPGLDKLNGPGQHRLAVLTVEEGSYTLVSHVTYANESWNLFSEESGFLWKLTASVTVQVQRGLRARVRVLPAINPTAPDPRLKLKLSHDVTAEMTVPLADVAVPDKVDVGAPAVAQAPAKTPPPPVSPVSTPVAAAPPVTAPVKAVEAPEEGPVAPAKLLLKVLAGKRPAAATVYLRSASGAPQRVVLDRKARKPVEVMLPPGDYRVDVLSQGYLAQTRKVTLSREAAPTVAFALARAPVKKSQKAQVKKEVVVLPRPPRFAEKQATPRKGSTAGLALLVDMLVRDESLRLRIEGHTDNRERPASARKALAEARAEAVAKALVAAGLDASRIETTGLGDARPKAPNLLPRGRELNRRVEFVLLRSK
ncbi:OmpA family protein [Myxococcus sp. Y35]|uniref:OmpA family protein n=1 Tax=Pseudomyxococcus flavus TaxID=3115648 RepID=UPI003CF22E8D